MKRIRSVKDVFYRRQIVFYHIPKCAGTSLSHAYRLRYMFSHFRLDEDITRKVMDYSDEDDWMTYKERLFRYHVLNGVNFVQGHVPFLDAYPEEIYERAVFITCLRDPIKRVISHYYFDPRLNKMSFDEFLSNHRGSIETSVYCRFFGGLPFSAGKAVEKHARNAIEALNRFDVVGILESPREFEAALKKKTGVTINLPRRNVGERNSSGDARITEGQKDKLREMCRYDYLVYDAFNNITNV